MSHGRLRGVPRDLQASMVPKRRDFQGRKFPRCLKEESSVFQENFTKKFQRCFKNVSMKFCFAILFLHRSHRSYLSRRRACF